MQFSVGLTKFISKMKFIAYLFYRYYATGPTKDIPYLSTLGAVFIMIFLHVMQLVVLLYLLFDIDVLGHSGETNRLKKFLLGALFVIPCLFLLRIYIREKDLKKMKYDKDKIKRGNRFLIIYIILNIALTTVLGMMKTGEIKI